MASLFATLNKVLSLNSAQPPKSSLPPLPETSAERLSSTTASTILYLAYGSNLSRETFIGNRDISPISSLIAHVPALDLTFDLAGLPYTEPCFANTSYRSPSSPSQWSKGLVGVVYEVTPEDYKSIIATEGGGASYQDVIVPCFPIAAGLRTVPSWNNPTTVILAHTLLAYPHIGGRVEREGGWAQPSARYLKLINDGALEHRLPDDYTRYIHSLEPYTITTRKQKIGQALFMAFWAPALLMMLALGKWLVDDNGRIPTWLVGVHTIFFSALWGSYDGIFKKPFGDGERTIEDDGDDDDEESGGRKRAEKGGLMSGEKGTKLER